VDEDAGVGAASNGMVVAIGDRAVNTVDFVAADLLTGGPYIGCAEAQRSFGDLGELDGHEIGEGAKVGS